MPRTIARPDGAPARRAATKPTKKAAATAKKAPAKKAAGAARAPAPRAASSPGAPAAALAAGARAPSFRLASDAGREVGLVDFSGRWLVLYFYPKDSTPGCTREAVAFQASLAALKKAGAAVVGVSRDSVASHCRFRDAQGLSFPLLSDPDAAVHQAYGAYGEKTMYGKKVIGAIRSTVLVRPDGTIARVWPTVKVDGHADEVLAAIRELAG